MGNGGCRRVKSTTRRIARVRKGKRENREGEGERRV